MSKMQKLHSTTEMAGESIPVVRLGSLDVG